MIPLLQTKTADTAHTGIFASVTPNFWAGPGDEARFVQRLPNMKLFLKQRKQMTSSFHLKQK